MKNSKLKNSPLYLALLGGLSLITGSAYAENKSVVIERTEESGTQTYNVKGSEDPGSKYLRKEIDITAPIKTVINIADPNLVVVKEAKDSDQYGALEFVTQFKTTRFPDAAPAQEVELNVTGLKSITAQNTKLEVNGLLLKTFFPDANPSKSPNSTDKIVDVNVKSTISGKEERTILAQSEGTENKESYSQSAVAKSYLTPGKNKSIYDAENTTYKSVVKQDGKNFISMVLTESIQHVNSSLDLEFNKGHIIAEGGKQARGIWARAYNYRLTKQEENKVSNVDVKFNGGDINVLSGANSTKAIGIETYTASGNYSVATNPTTTINGGSITVAAGTDGQEIGGVLIDNQSTKSRDELTGQEALITQNNGTITVDAANQKVGGKSQSYGIFSNTISPLLAAKVVQTGGSVTLNNTKQSDIIGAGLKSAAKLDAIIEQGESGSVTVTGDNNAAFYAKSTENNNSVTIAGTGDATTYGIYTETKADKESTINIKGTAKLYAETAVFNNSGNSTITVAKEATIGKDNQKSKFSLGLGNDNLTFSGTSLNNVGELDGGQDANVTTDFDTLTLTDYSGGLELGNRIKNWEKVELKNGTYTLTGNNTTVGSGTSTDGKVGGLEIADNATFTAGTANIAGDIHNKGTATFNESTNVAGTVNNENSLTVDGESTVTTLNNKDGATVDISAKLTGTVNNQGTANLKAGANVVGTVNNEKTLALESGSTITGELNNKANATATLDQATVTGSINNDSTLTLANDSIVTGALNNKAGATATLNQATVKGALENDGTVEVTGASKVTTLNNKANATVNVNAALTGDLNNQENATANLAAKLTGNLNNQGTATLKANSEVEGTVTNAKTLTLEDNSKVTGTLTNNQGATATLNQATVAGTLENAGTVDIAGDSTVTTLNNKANATVNVNAALAGDLNNQADGTANLAAKLTGNLDNKGTATLGSGSEVEGTVTNAKDLTLEDNSKVTGTLNNSKGATATLNQATITGTVENQGTVNVNGNTTVTALNNQENATANVNSTLTGDLNNEGTATLNAGANVTGAVTNSKNLTVAGDSTVGSLTNAEKATVEVNANLTGNLTNKGTANVASQTFTGNLANESTGTLNLNSDTTVTGTLDNQGKAVLGGTVLIKDTFTNTGTAVLAGDITAQNGINNEAGAKLAIDNTYAGNLTNKGETIISGKQFTGNLTNEGTAQLKDGLNLAGVLTNTGTTKVDGQVTVSSLNNNSVVDLRSETAGKFSTLTVAGDLDGNGTVKVNAKLDGNHKTDHDTLAVQGNVNGTTIIEVTNTGDKNVDSNSIEGVELVSLADSSKIADPNQAFKLLAPVESGIYEYNTLAYNTEAGKKGFYLRSVANRSLEIEGRTVRLYRQAAVAYALNQQINSQAIHDVTTNLHQRQGEQRAETNYLNPHQSWVRVLSNKNHLQADNLLADSGEYGIQIGWDFNTRKGGTSRSGLYGVYTKVDSKIGDNYRSLSNIPGKIDTDLASLGLYNTTYFGNSYLNLVAAFNYLYSDYEVHNGGSQKGFGGAASIEAGSKFALANNFFFEPQIQVSYQFTHYQDFQDVLADIEGFNHQSLRPRAGFRLGYSNVKGTNLWLHANLEFEALKAKNFNIGHELIATKQASKTIYDLGLNGQVALSPTTVLYGSAQYKASLGKKQTLTNGEKVTTAKFHGFGGEVGLRFTW